LRKRYLALKVESEQPLNRGEVRDVVWEAVLKLFGEYGASQASLSLIECDSQKNYAIVRCSHKTLEIVKASIASITEMNGKPAAIHILGVSGTLKALSKKTLPQE
jgi:ribonuclease P/MRP protein subunit POP5